MFPPIEVRFGEEPGGIGSHLRGSEIKLDAKLRGWTTCVSRYSYVIDIQIKICDLYNSKIVIIIKYGVPRTFRCLYFHLSNILNT